MISASTAHETDPGSSESEDLLTPTIEAGSGDAGVATGSLQSQTSNPQLSTQFAQNNPFDQASDQDVEDSEED